MLAREKVMILNSIDVDDRLISRYLTLSSLPGGRNMSLQQQEYVSNLTYRNTLPEWISEPGMFFFDKASLIKENKDLTARMEEGPWLSGSINSSISPGFIDPQDLILIGGNFMEEHFIGIWRRHQQLSVVISEDIDGKFAWKKVFEHFEGLLETLEV